MIGMLAAGYPRVAKTLELLSRQYTWIDQRKDVEIYIQNCHTCKRAKPTRHAPYGTLKPLEIPDQPWQHLTMDFVTGLPEDSGFNAILMVVDRLTKMRHIIPCREACSARKLADLYLNNVFRYHGLPMSIVSDRSPQFDLDFWKTFCELVGIDTAAGLGLQTNMFSHQACLAFLRQMRARVEELEEFRMDDNRYKVFRMSAREQRPEDLLGVCQFSWAPPSINYSDRRKSIFEEIAGEGSWSQFQEDGTLNTDPTGSASRRISNATPSYSNWRLSQTTPARTEATSTTTCDS